MVTFDFEAIEANLRGPAAEWAFVDVEATFSVFVHGRRFYCQELFCVVELAVALMAWLGDGDPLAPFRYTSIESKVEGLVEFAPIEDATWTLTCRAPDASEEVSAQVSAEALRAASAAFVSRLRTSLLPQFDLLDCATDREAVLNFPEKFGAEG